MIQRVSMNVFFKFYLPSLLCRVHSVHTTKQTPHQKMADAIIWLCPPTTRIGKKNHNWTNRKGYLGKDRVPTNRTKIICGNACVQRAVWRKRGSGSPESLCKFESLSPVRTAVEPPPASSRWDVIGKCRKQYL